jgi:hypothetical protein
MERMFEVCAVIGGKEMRHVAGYNSAEQAGAASECHLGPNDTITDVIELPEGIYADTRRLAAAMLDQTADDGFKLM